MIVCFQCSPKTKMTLDSLIETGQYKDYTEAISSAVENLSILQKEILKKGALVIGQDGPSASQMPNMPATAKDVTLSQQPSSQTFNPEESKKSKTKQHFLKEGVMIPRLFLLDGIGEAPPPLAGSPTDVWTTGQEVPLDRWIFGQYNKLLPAKVNCRALAHLLVGEPKGIPFEEATSRIAEEAVILGSFLTRHDEQNGIGRDDALSTAFPSIEDNAEKSRLRYANQFVASVNKQGQVSGLLIDLKLINHTGGKKTRLLLTEVGWRFATLRNPIFDSAQEKPAQKFSAEEITFLLDHISRSVPAEDFAYRAILTAIVDGADTPDKLDTALQKYLSPKAAKNLSKSFLSSQRSGAISRMTDLGLAVRVRDGVRVSYIITDGGKQYAESAR